MRGRIIHYNSLDGKGLIASGQLQFPFEISQWRIGVAPAVNQCVEIDVDGNRARGVVLVSRSALLRKAARHWIALVGNAFRFKRGPPAQ